MDDKVQQAQNEIASASLEAQGEAQPQSLDEIVAGLKGFGIEEIEEMLTINCKGGKQVRLRISNIPTTDELQAVMAADEFKGYLWIKRVKVELLSRAITWLGLGEGKHGISLKGLPQDKRFVGDPTDDGKVRDIQVVLRNLIMTWGQEITEILWKVLMTHSQNIENRMGEQFPDSAVMTDVERRLFEQAQKQIDEQTKVIVQEQVARLYDADIDGTFEEEKPEPKNPETKKEQ
jgi:hypothetical protein